MADGRSEFFGTEDGHDQVSEAGESDEADEDGFHGSGRGESAHPVAKPDVGGREGEKCEGEREENEVVHWRADRVLDCPMIELPGLSA
jgi:hypothetical protein